MSRTARYGAGNRVGRNGSRSRRRQARRILGQARDASSKVVEIRTALQIAVSNRITLDDAGAPWKEYERPLLNALFRRRDRSPTPWLQAGCFAFPLEVLDNLNMSTAKMASNGWHEIAYTCGSFQRREVANNRRTRHVVSRPRLMTERAGILVTSFLPGAAQQGTTIEAPRRNDLLSVP